MQKISEYFLWYLLHKKMKPKSFHANYFSFYPRRPFPTVNNQNPSWRCKQVLEMQNEDALFSLLSCTISEYTRVKGVSWRRDSCGSSSLRLFIFLPRVIPCVGLFEREKKPKAFNICFISIDGTEGICLISYLNINFGNF